jgi:hypothetical protein
LCLGVLLAALAASGCDADKCKGFQPRCEGDVVVLCSAPNEFGTGSGIKRMPCKAPNPVCMMVGQSPWCVTSPTPGCASPEVNSCRGSLFVWCIRPLGDGGQERGHEQVTDCATQRTATGAPYVCSVGTFKQCVPPG